MKTLSVVIALALISACTANSGLVAGPSSTEATPAEFAQIRAATNAWNAAIVAKDVAALQSIMAPEFALTGEDGGPPFPRDLWLQNLQRMSLQSYHANVVDVRTYGKIAIARVEGGWDVTLNGRRRNETFQLADFWVHRDGRWQVSRRHRID